MPQKKIWRKPFIDQDGQIKQAEEIQHDFIPHGANDERAALLSLRRVREGEKVQFACRGWTFMRPERFWHPLMNREWVQAQLENTVAELESVPGLPDGCQPMWKPY